MDARYLTELCARSIGWGAGAPLVWDVVAMCVRCNGSSFAPLDSNNDSFILAVRRGLTVEQDEDQQAAYVVYHKDGWAACCPYAVHDGDMEKATRQAITEAAAHQYLASESVSSEG